MARSFFPVNRDQLDCLPLSVSDMVAQDDLCHFIIDVVEAHDCSRFLATYKDGKGQKCYHPQMMLALLLMSYCIGVRSSRAIESLCRNDLRFRVISGAVFPDHTSIARFRQRFRTEFKDLFVSTLELCREAGMGKLGAVSIDGTKLKANASMSTNRTRKQLAEEVEQILKQAEEIDELEDSKASSEYLPEPLPEPLRTKASRIAQLRAAKQRLKRVEQAHEKADRKSRHKIDKYDQAIARRDEKQACTGHKPAGHVVKPPTQDELDKTRANSSDPDSELLKSSHGYVQGYNAQIAVSEDGLIVGAMVATARNDMAMLTPMIRHVEENTARATLGAVGEYCADGGYWCPQSISEASEHIQQRSMDQRPGLLVSVPRRWQKLTDNEISNQIDPNAPLLVRQEHRQRCPAGQEVYRIRAQTAEPVFGQIKSARRYDRFMQRGLENANTEWQLICLTHNLMKLYRHQLALNN